jgi:alkylation response protein AidB-like acyl-CoA dehydrogenase
LPAGVDPERETVIAGRVVDRDGRAVGGAFVRLLDSSDEFTAGVLASGRLPGVEGSMAKLFASEAITRQAADFVDMLGPDGIRSEGDPTAVEGGAAEYAYRFALGTTTYGGTSEVQRNIIAQRGLGLPRPR